MTKIPFPKHYQSPAEIVALLKSRGLGIKDESLAEQTLQSIGYYRFSAYLYPLIAAPKEAQRFKPKSTFERALSLYRFDQELRLFLFRAIAEVEVAVRAAVANIVAEESGNIFWITDEKMFVNKAIFAKTKAIIDGELRNSHEDFINHFQTKYSNPYPPAWMLTEVLPVGALNHIYNNLADNTLRKKVAAAFSLPTPVFSSWFTIVALTRNSAAHHARVWNKENAIPPVTPKKLSRPWISPAIPKNRIFYDISILKYFLDIIRPGNDMKHLYSNSIGKSEYQKILDETGYDYFGKMRAKLSEHEAEVRKSLSSTIETANRLKKTLKENGLKDEEIRLQIKAFIDQKYINRELDDLARDLMYRDFGIPIKVNKDDALKAIRTLNDDIQEYFDGKTYDIKLRPRIVGKDLVDASEEFGKDIKNWEKVIAQLKGGTYNGIQYKAATGTNFYHYKLEDLDEEQREIAGLLDATKIAENQKAAALKLLADEKKKHPDTTLTVEDFIKEGYIKLSKEQLIKIAEAGKKREQEAREILGYALDKDKGKKGKDPYQEQLEAQIKLIEDMMAKYKELHKVQGQYDAAENTVKAFEEQIKDVKLSKTLVDLFVPNDEGDITAVGADIVDKIRKGFTDNNLNFIRGMNLDKYLKEYRAAGEKIGKWNTEVEVSCDEETLKQTKKRIEAAFAGKELSDKFKEMGLPLYEIKKLPFFEDMKTSWAEVYAEINKKYNPNNLSDDELKQSVGENVYKEYEDATKKAKEGEEKERQKNMEHVIRSYRTQLSEQLQLDRWYREEQDKIYAKDKDGNYLFTKEQQQEYKHNLDKQYNSERNANIMNKFKESGAYVAVFQSIEHASGETLKRLRARLDEVGASMKDLDPTQLREIASIQTKIFEMQAKGDPFASLRIANKEVNDLKKQGLSEDVLNQNIINNSAKITTLEDENNILQQILEGREAIIIPETISEERNQAIEELIKRGADAINEQIQNNKRNIDELKKGNQIAEKQLTSFQKQRIAKEQMIATVQKVADAEAKLYSKSRDLMKVLGVDDDDLVFADMAQDLIQMSLEAIQFQMNLELMGVAAEAAGVELNSMLGIIGWVSMALTAVVTIFSALFAAHDKKLERQITRLKDKVDSLKESLDELTKSLEDAWDIRSLQEYSDQIDKNIDMQIESYEEMIALEKEKKDTDSSKIKDWEKEIRELEKIRQEEHAKLRQEAGGFGDTAAYKDAAQAFVDAWADAYKEGADALGALEGKFNEYIENMLKKQAMLRIAKRYLSSYFEEMDKLAEDSTTMSDADFLMRMKGILENAGERLPELSDTLEEFFSSIGFGNARLSALTQSIQGITETTAEALEAMLNSMRGGLFEQKGYVREIRDYLLSSSVDDSPSAPMLTELRAQTNYLQRMCEHFDAAFTYGPSSGKGLRVYMA